jgi:hypothetical protein
MQETIAEIGQTLRSIPAERYPQLSAHGREMTSGSGDERFAFAVDTFLDGLVARSERTAR